VNLPTLTRARAPADAAAVSGTAAGWAGVVAAGVGLATTELVGGLVGSGSPLVPAVGSRIIDLGAGSLKNVAVAVFGTNDKPALIIGIVLVCLLAGWFIGRAARRRRWAGPVGFAAFAVIGFLAAVGTPLTSPAALAVAALAGTCAGLLALQGLLGLAARAADPESSTPVSDRRRFLLTASGAAVLAALAAVAGRQMRSTRSVNEARAQVKLPAPTSTVPVPAAQPFDVPGLSSYITPNAEFYRIDTALLVPLVDVTTWQLSVTGMVDRPFSLSFSELIGMGVMEAPVTLACVSNEVGGDLVGNAVWRGVPLRTVLDRAGVHPEATQIVGRSVDGFTVGFPTATGLDGRTAMVAVGMNGRPLPISHGFPARLVVAGLYGYVSATKWLTEIELTRLEEFDAYWIPRGWAKEGPIKTESRIDVPADGAKLPAGTRTIAGVAWAPSRGISRVEVQIDGGAWREAELGRVASANTWVQWLYRWDSSPGRHQIRVRATDGTGAVQTAVRRPPAPDGASGYHMRRVEIT
jgi:DMSO/TMAO reductase YedYZ molybdopterin-dependent catalytic subunit